MINIQTKAIIHDLGIDNLPGRRAKEVMAKLEENIQRKLVLEIMDLLSESDQQTITELIKSNKNEKVMPFLLEKIPNMDSLIRAVAGLSVKEFKDSIK